MNVPRHPAKFSDTILAEIRAIAEAEQTEIGRSLLVLDPFAGVGRVHELESIGATTVGVELELEWAAAHPRTLVGDATALPFLDDCFDAVVTSCCYGNRMADHHEASDASRRNTYRHALGHPLSPNSAGALAWGVAYMQLHEQAWIEALRVLRPGGLFVLNISNHIRKGVEIHVAEWHLRKLLLLGCRVEEIRRVRTPRLRHGANAGLRVDGELVMVLRRPVPRFETAIHAAEPEFAEPL